jgi:hypothetical protein
VEPLSLLALNPVLFLIIADMNLYCYRHKIPFVITRTVDHVVYDGQVSRSHSESRAADLSIKGWTTKDITDFEHHFENKYKSYAAIGYESGKPNLIVHHNIGLGDHLHCQIKPNL